MIYRFAFIFFQSTPPRRRRRYTTADVNDNVFSIHASAKEATSFKLGVNVPCQFSIHASAKEATGILALFIMNHSFFNPRLREGGDGRYVFVSPFCVLVFNPRLREGGDEDLQDVRKEIMTFSIHASAKEATLFARAKQMAQVFQSTPPRRRRQRYFTYRITTDSFQSTPPRRRRRLLITAWLSKPLYFNPRLREGGD